MIAARRVRAHSALFAALAGVCALLAGLAVGLMGHLDSAALDGVRGGIARLHGGQAELRFDAPKTGDDARQRAHAAGIIARELRHGAASVPVLVTHREVAHGSELLWTVRADATRITPADLPTLARAGARIHAAMLDDLAVGAQGVEASGSLDRQAGALAARVAPLRAIAPVPLLLVAAIGLVTLAELARLLDGVRLRETALLRSRGASAARMAGAAALEALIVGGAGALLGAGAATGALWLAGEHPLGRGAAAAIVLAVIGAAVALVAAVALGSARRVFRRDTAEDSGRARRLAAPGLLVLLVGGAAFSLWRFLRFGSPLSPTRAGAQLDPVAVLAPALCLAALAALCLLAVPALARLVAGAAARRDGARLALVAGQLARRARLIASPITLIALAGGGLIVAACYTPSWQAAATATETLRSGGDLVVTGAGGADAAAVRAAAGVRAAAPAVQFSWRDDSGKRTDLAALGLGGLRHAISPARGAADPSALARALAVPLRGAPIPDGATRLDLATASHGAAPTLVAFLVDAAGVGTREQAVATSPLAARLSLPRGTGRRLVALEVDVPGRALTAGDGRPPAPVSFRLGSVTARGDGVRRRLELGRPWKPVGGESSSGFSARIAPDGTLGFTATPGPNGAALRFVPPEPQRVPVAVSRALARQSGAAPGDTLRVDLSGSVGGGLAATVAVIRPELPGAQGERAMLADLAALQTQRVMLGADPLPAGRLWLRSDSPHRTAAALAASVPGARVSGPAVDPGGLVLAAVPAALWLGMAGGAALALIALAAVAGELLRLRADEVAVLRALGFPPPTLARLRGWELGSACLAAALGAAVSGAVVSALVVPGLAHAAIEHPFAALPLPLHLDLRRLGAAALAAGVVAAGIITAYGARVARQARTTVAGEGER
jgi:hypothetical protein